MFFNNIKLFAFLILSFNVCSLNFFPYMPSQVRPDQYLSDINLQEKLKQANVTPL